MEYYVVINPRFRKTAYAFGEEKSIKHNTGEAKHCPDCNSPISMLEWLPPLDVSLSKKTIGDFIYGTFVGFIVSEKFKSAYINEELLGITRFRNVNLFYRSRLLQLDYFLPDIEIIYAFIDMNNLELKKQELCDTCQIGRSLIYKINGIRFLNPSEINSDIFFTTTLGMSSIIISERFKIFVEKNGFTNFEVIDCFSYKWDCFKPRGYDSL